jgi:hypothetical protein
MIAAKEGTILAPNRLNRKIQENVKQLRLCFGPGGPHQSNILLNMTMLKSLEHSSKTPKLVEVALKNL